MKNLLFGKHLKCEVNYRLSHGLINLVNDKVVNANRASGASGTVAKSRNYQLPLNPILARKDFPSKGLARYKKCQQRRNNYISQAGPGEMHVVEALRQGMANPEFLDLAR
jgi:hypothetical protein